MENQHQGADKHNWTKEELEAYDYVLMREQGDRGRLTKVLKDVAKHTKLPLDQVKKING